MNNRIDLVKAFGKAYADNKILSLKLMGLFFSLWALCGCGSFNQDNLYGNGHYVSQEEMDANTIYPPDKTDYQAYQQNFISISVRRVSYNLTQTLSQITVEGTCFNPGFQYNSIYFNAVDSSGSSMASDGMAYSTNIRYYPGSTQLQPSNIYCSSSGQWSTVINVPTAILYRLAQGYLDVSMVVWYKGTELHNETTGVTSTVINPPALEEPPLQDEDSSAIPTQF